jgi:hypothetical protein
VSASGSNWIDHRCKSLGVEQAIALIRCTAHCAETSGRAQHELYPPPVLAAFARLRARSRCCRARIMLTTISTIASNVNSIIAGMRIGSSNMMDLRHRVSPYYSRRKKPRKVLRRTIAHPRMRWRQLSSQLTCSRNEPVKFFLFKRLLRSVRRP